MMKRQSHIRILGALLMMVAAAISSQAPLDDGTINLEGAMTTPSPDDIMPNFDGKFPVKPNIRLNPGTMRELGDFAHFDRYKQLEMSGNNNENPSAKCNGGKCRKGQRENTERIRNQIEKTSKYNHDSEEMDDETVKSIVNGISSIEEVIHQGRKFFRDNKRFDVRKGRIPYHTGLAAQYGTLSSRSIKEMDKNLKAVIAGTNRLMKRLQSSVDNIGAEIPFDDYLATMNQNVMLKVKEGTKIVNSSVLGFENLNWFKFDGSPEKKKVYKVLSWFTNLIHDTDVLKDTRIDIEDLANIVAATGAAVSDFLSVFYAQDYVERSIVDVGVLRYPDPVHPFFKLFRIQIFAYRKSTRVLATQKDEAGIKGDYECIQFVPREEILNKMNRDVMKKAVSEAEAMFDF